MKQENGNWITINDGRKILFDVETDKAIEEAGTDCFPSGRMLARNIAKRKTLCDK